VRVGSTTVTLGNTCTH